MFEDPMVEEKKRQQAEELKVLRALRQTRRSRGGTEPLDVPKHLRASIIITDDDLKGSPPISRE